VHGLSPKPHLPTAALSYTPNLAKSRTREGYALPRQRDSWAPLEPTRHRYMPGAACAYMHRSATSMEHHP